MTNQQDELQQEQPNEVQDEEFGSIFSILDLKAELNEMRSTITGIQAKIESMNQTIAVVSKQSSNSGSQVFSGDVGLVSVFAITVLLCFGIVGWTRYQIHKLRNIIATKKDNSEMDPDFND